MSQIHAYDTSATKMTHVQSKDNQLKVTDATTLTIDGRLDEVIGHINNTNAIGDGQNALKNVPLGYDRSNGKGVALLVDSAGKLDIQHIQSIDTRLDNTIGAINNSGAIGSGSSVLKNVPLGYDRANDVGRSFLVDSLGHLQVDVVSTATPTGGATEAKQDVQEVSLDAILAKNTEIETSCDALISANHTDLLALETTLTEIATDGNNIQTKLDTMIGHNDGVETLLTAIDGVLDNILTKNTEIETTNNANQVLLGTIDADTNAIKTAVEILDNAISGSEMQCDIVTLPALATGSNTIGTVNLSATDNAVLDTIDAVLDNILTKNTEIDTVLDTVNGKITACNTGAVVISSGAVTASLSATDNAVLDAIATDGDNIQTLLTTMDGVLDNILTKNGEIETTNNANQVLLGTIDADTGAIKTAVEILDNAISGNEMQCDIITLPALATGSNTIGTVNLSATDNAVLDTIDAVLDNILTKNTEIDTVLDTVNGKITACNTGAVVISSGAVTATLSATDNAVLDAIDAVLDTIKVDTEAIETAVETLAGGGTTGEWLASASLADTTYSAALDCSAFQNVRVMGIASATIGMAGMPILGSQTSGGTYYALQASEKITETQTSIGGVTKYMLSAVIEHTPKFLKVYNNSGGSKTFELDYVGYVN